MASSQASDGLTLAVLGSGVMGIAVMGGVMSKLSSMRTQKALGKTSSEPTPSKLPNKFIACDAWKGAEETVKNALGHYNFPLSVLINDNIKGVQQGDVILLSCKPFVYKQLLAEPGIKEALAGKILISIMAGISGEQIEEAIYGLGEKPKDACRVVRVMPNTAAFIGESMSVIATSSPPLSDDQYALITWIFNAIGKTVTLPPAAMDASTALCGSGPAFCALVLEALADGGVAMGIPRKEAQLMAAQTMKGTAGLVLNGEHPALLKDKVSTPGGTTIGGLMVLEEGTVRGNIARAVREAAVVASELGKGTKNVNGTRW